MDRRGFLKGILALSAAPAIVKADALMRIATPKLVLYGDGIHDDADALECVLNGGRVIVPSHVRASKNYLVGGSYLIGRCIRINATPDMSLFIDGCGLIRSTGNNSMYLIEVRNGSA